MNFKSFLKNKIIFLLIHSSVIIFTGVFLSVLKLNLYVISYLLLIYIISFIVSLLVEYIPKKNYYQEVIRNLENLDKKYLLSELVEEPSFIEGQILSECLRITNKSMNDEIAKYLISSKEYREYIELWIHEVKTPIASSKLIIENNPSEVTNSLSEELDAVDYYLEQVLFYSRSNSVEKDYIIKETPLKALVQQVIRNNSKSFIREKIKLTLDVEDYTVNTDTKWLEFILNQVVVNSIKYHGSEPVLQILAKENRNSISLFIKDNGIGISEQDLPMIFKKGYTGKTGRNYAKSTGIGLYLCKKLCDRLGLSIHIESEEKIGTAVEIVFPKTDFMQVD